MKAIVFQKYGRCREALALCEVELPKIGATQVLVRVKAASINALDYRRFEKPNTLGKFFETKIFRNIGIIPGADISGIVHQVGGKVTKFMPGDEVFGFTVRTRGGFAEYSCAEEKELIPKPANVSFEAAATIPVAGSVALQAINKCKDLKPGLNVLINGASGGVGSFALQLAKSLEAKVTAICSTRNIENVKSDGADEIIDYSKKDFAEQSKIYDFIIAVNGNNSILKYKKCLKGGGKYIAVGGEMKQIFQAILWGPIISLFSNKKMMFLGISKANGKNLETLGYMIETGKIIPRIDKTFPLSQAIDAFESILYKHSRGKVILTI